MSTPLPNRQSIRKRGWDYTTPGWYFVTINTRDGRALFGAIVNGRMVLNEAGRIAEGCWLEIPKHFPQARVDEHVIMPNHVHGLIELVRAGGSAIAHGSAIADPCALGDVVGAYKAAVSRDIGRGGQLPTRTIAAGASVIWHRNYWDEIVRDERALANIRNYIRNNPANYERVMNVGEPRMLGNAGLLALPKVGYLASRGADARAGATARAGACEPGGAIISGFLSPMEREVFQEGMAHTTPLIWVKPWGLEDGTLAAPVRRAIDEGRLLVVSPFADDIEAPSVRRAAWCNQYVLAHCDRLIVGHLTPGGMLACILSEADPDLEITYL